MHKSIEPLWPIFLLGVLGILHSRSCSSSRAGKETFFFCLAIAACAACHFLVSLSLSLQTAVDEGCCWSTWDLHSESLNGMQEKDKLPGNGPCKWPWFELLDELIGGSPKQSRIGSARKQARFLCSPPQPRPAGGVPTPYFGGGELFLMGYLAFSSLLSTPIWIAVVICPSIECK